MTKYAAALTVVVLITLRLLGQTPHLTSTAPQAQVTAVTPTMTDEPAKSPYVFPTPVFIPTYPGDTPSAPSAPSTPIKPTGQTTYTVQSGDSPWVIAQKVYGDGTKYPIILSANGLTTSSRLRVGQVLQIPALGLPVTPTSAATPLPVATIAPSPEPTQPGEASTGSLGTPTPSTGESSTPLSPIQLPAVVITAINVLAGMLALAGTTSGVLAVLIYGRERRMASLNAPKKWLTFR